MTIRNTMREVVYSVMNGSRVDNDTLYQPGRACESNIKRVHIKKALHIRYCLMFNHYYISVSEALHASKPYFMLNIVHS